MAQNRFVSITIARQLGSGGSELAQRVARELGWVYLDRELLRQAAEELGIDANELIRRDERVTSFWQKLLDTFTFGSLEGLYTPPPLQVRDEQLIDIERRIMCRAARENNCVIVGRGGFHFLHGHARLFNVFVHAPHKLRCRRVAEIYKVENPKAVIEKSDRDREQFIRWATGHRWLDLRNYHLCIDTARIGLENAKRWIVEQARRMVANKSGNRK